MDGFLGEIRMFSFSFAPKQWAFCNGQLLPIAQNQALFALLGANYGGNGQTTFALPDLRSRVPVGYGTSPNYPLASVGGVQSVQLQIATIPPHNHALNARGGTAGNVPIPPNNLPAAIGAGPPGVTINVYAQAGTGQAVGLATDSVSNTGGNGAHNNLQPYQATNYCICTQGVFPSRS